MRFINYLALSLLLATASCKREITPQKALYVWESDRHEITPGEQAFLNKHKIEKLYIKFFEVEKNTDFGIHPTAKSDLEIGDNLSHMALIPTVYIRNNVFKQVTQKQLDEFVDNLLFLLHKRYKEHCPHAAPFKEIQMDCDWTISTQANYFYFLRKLKEKTNVQISATLRLYPYKFPDKMGVLPVDRAMLMCYNLLSPLDAGKRNSILDLQELEKYLKGAEKYPIPLDLALPTYSSALLFQNEHFAGIHYLNGPSLMNYLRKKKGSVYHVVKDTLLGPTFLRAGDQVKLEKVDVSLLQRAIKIINQNVCFEEGASLSLFHLTTSQLNSFSHEEITSIYSPLSH